MALSPSSSPHQQVVPPPVPHTPQLLAVPAGYCLCRLVEGSVAAPLPPVVYDARRRALQVVLVGAAAEELAVEVLVCQPEVGAPLLVYGLDGHVDGKKTTRGGRAQDRGKSDALRAQLLTVLGLDEDLALFHAMTGIDRDLEWAAANDAGRSLRSPRVFEDLLKGIVRARLPGRAAQQVCAQLCAHYGPPTTLNRRGFPTEQTLAQVSCKQLASKLGGAARWAERLAQTIHALSTACVHGSFYPESLRRLPTGLGQLLTEEGGGDDPSGRVVTAIDAQLEWQMRVDALLRRLPGFGERASAGMLPLLGCHDGPALDIDALRAWQGRFSARRAAKQARLQARSAEADAVAQRIVRRVGRYALYAGLAQRLLLAGPPA